MLQVNYLLFPKYMFALSSQYFIEDSFGIRKLHTMKHEYSRQSEEPKKFLLAFLSTFWHLC